MKKQRTIIILFFAITMVVSGCATKKLSEVKPTGENNQNRIIQVSNNLQVYNYDDMLKWKMINNSSTKGLENSDTFIIPYSNVNSNYTFINLIGNKSVALQYENNNYTDEIKDSSQLVGNDVYYVMNSKLNVVNAKGDSRELDYIKEPVNKFIISSDEKKVVFVSPEKNISGFTIASVYQVDFLDKAVNKIGEIREKNPSTLYSFIRFVNNEVYIGTISGEIGGYIIFLKPTNLYRIDPANNTIENLTKNFGEGNEFNDISNDGRYLSTFYKGYIKIFDLSTKKEIKKFDIPTSDGFTIAGNVYFSNDSQYLIYDTAKHNPENEQYLTVLINLNSGIQKTLIDKNSLLLTVDRWISDNKILMRNYDNYYILDIKSSELKEVNIIKNK